MDPNKAQPAPKHVSFDFMREHAPGDTFPTSSFLVTISDEALLTINRDHPARYLITRFNGAASPATRLRSLSEALSEFEIKNMVRVAHKESAVMGMIGRALRSGVATAFVLGTIFGAALGAFAVALNR